jgi:CheY-like chemotaxis protein
VLLLDLNLPGMSGLEFLAEVRKDPQLSGTVVFVMTDSNDPADAADAYSLRVAGCLRKSDLGRNYQALISLIDAYMACVTLPDPNLG